VYKLNDIKLLKLRRLYRLSVTVNAQRDEQYKDDDNMFLCNFGIHAHY